KGVCYLLCGVSSARPESDIGTGLYLLALYGVDRGEDGIDLNTLSTLHLFTYPTIFLSPLPAGAQVHIFAALGLVDIFLVTAITDVNVPLPLPGSDHLFGCWWVGVGHVVSL